MDFKYRTIPVFLVYMKNMMLAGGRLGCESPSRRIFERSRGRGDVRGRPRALVKVGVRSGSRSPIDAGVVLSLPQPCGRNAGASHD